MAMQFVENGGRLIILASSGAGTPLHSGLCASQTSYRATVNQSTAQCQESAEEEKFTSLVSHELSATYNYQVGDTSKLFGLGDGTLYAHYLAQNGTTLFSGSVLITSVSDNQGARGSVETQDISLTNNGSPAVGFGI